MNKFRLLPIALTALVLGSCSSEDVIDNGGQPQWNDKGKGYINLAIQLPTQPSTRANDNFDDGTPAEYEVNNATLILFVKGQSDDDYKVNSAYNMNLNFSPEGSTTDNITTTAKITQEINSVSGDIKALVVLNNNGLFSIAEGGILNVNGAPATGKSLSELNDAVKTAIGTDYSWHDDGLLMSNAIMADAKGGTVEPTSANVVEPLVTIDGSKIFKTKAEADANPAATIYVERAEAKVTVKNGANGTVTDESGLTYTIDGWALDNTNQTNKLVRDVTDFDTWKAFKATRSSDYRFVGGIEIASGLYRVYWGDDYNYSTTGVGGLTTVGGEHATLSAVNPANGEFAAYCFENTTNLANMLEQNLTRVIVKATFNGGTEFYTVDGNRSEIWQVADVKKEVAARLLTDVEFSAWAKDNVDQGKTLSSDTDFDVTFSTEAAGKRTVATIVLNESGKGKLKAGAAEYPTNAATLANDHIALEYYANGDAYYPVYIRHFDETQTPWDATYETGNSIYANKSDEYLGRFGVLRNNWYEINITSIKSLGDPNVTEVTSEPVDKKESYISVEINVLSWAKRTQDVNL